MADEKKPEAKPAAPSMFAHPDPFVEIVWTILALLILAGVLATLLSGVLDVFSGGYNSNPTLLKVRNFFLSVFYGVLAWRYIFFLFYLAMIGWIVYLHRKIVELRLIEKKLLYPEIKVEEVGYVNPHWERVVSQINSLNENDWRLAIIEADIMLDDILNKLGLPGDTMGDKLKVVERSDFTTIDNAWEAHKIRNQIAHEGPSFRLNQHEAKRVIGLYETVFSEFKVI